MSESTMQYLVSLSDETVEKIIKLEKKLMLDMSKVIDMAIHYTYQSHHQPEENSATKFASSLAISILKQTLEDGKSIYIPSLDITISPGEEE